MIYQFMHKITVNYGLIWCEETKIICDHKIDKVIIKELKLGDYVMVKC